MLLAKLYSYTVCMQQQIPSLCKTIIYQQKNVERVKKKKAFTFMLVHVQRSIFPFGLTERNLDFILKLFKRENIDVAAHPRISQLSLQRLSICYFSPPTPFHKMPLYITSFEQIWILIILFLLDSNPLKVCLLHLPQLMQKKTSLLMKVKLLLVARHFSILRS